MKFNQVNPGERGRPRVNKGDKTGSVRVTINMPGAEGNISRSITFGETKVSDVFAAIQESLVSAKSAVA